LAETIALYWGYVLSLSAIIVYIKRLSINRFYFYVLIFKLFLVSVLFALPDKLAAKELSEVPERGLFHNFSVYYYLSLPLFELTGNARASFAAISTLASFWIACAISLRPYLLRRKALFLLMNFFPDVLYFHAFSLRDIFIVFLQVIFILKVYEIFFLQWSCKISISLVTFLIFLLRIEVLIWCLVVLALFFLGSRFRLRPLIAVLGLITGLLALSANYIVNLILHSLGLIASGHADFIDALYFVIRARFYRQFSDADGSGTTSSIISPDIFEAVAPEFYILISLFSAFFLSLWSAGPSIYIARLTYFIVFFEATRKLILGWRLRKVPLLFYLSALMSFMIYAPLIVNGGNALRMRLASLLLLLLVGHVIKSKSGTRHEA
jgi:hypothetical protein